MHCRLALHFFISPRRVKVAVRAVRVTGVIQGIIQLDQREVQVLSLDHQNMHDRFQVRSVFEFFLRTLPNPLGPVLRVPKAWARFLAF